MESSFVNAAGAAVCELAKNSSLTGWPAAVTFLGLGAMACGTCIAIVCIQKNSSVK